MAETNKKSTSHNVVVFGQTGAGKSSIVNMLAGSRVAEESANASGCTRYNHPSSVSHKDDTYTFWDTAGLNESESGTVPHQKAVQNLQAIIKERNPDLLIYCIRDRLVDIICDNYKSIYTERIPMVLVVTGLESKVDMDGWWSENKEKIKKMKMSFVGHACITSWKGKNNAYLEEYEQSIKKLWELVSEHCRVALPDPVHNTTLVGEALNEGDQVLPRMTKGNGSLDKTQRNDPCLDRTTTRNVVVFGQTGSGKSSMINMLAGHPIARVHGGLASCTASNEPYHIARGDEGHCIFWDTQGFNESNDGTIGPQDAVQNLLSLVKDQGTNLLIYCIHPRIVETIQVNYDFFWKTICMEKVPIVLVVTGLEGYDDMEEWWQKNEKEFKKMKMKFSGHACITSWKGREGLYERAYEESAKKVWELVKVHSAPMRWYRTPESVQAWLMAYEKNHKPRLKNGILRYFVK